MITFKELKEKTTPEIIRKMCELAEGFEYIKHHPIWKMEDEIYFPLSKNNIEVSLIINYLEFLLLLHRAVEGWNNTRGSMISIHKDAVVFFTDNCEGYNDDFNFEKYEPCHLTQCEMAIWDCLLNIL